MLTFSFYTCLTLFVIVCLFLILLILIQKGRGGGLASAFGGAGGNTAFGSKTGDVLTWATSIIFGVFIVLAVVLNLVSNAMDERHKLEARHGSISLPAQSAPPSFPMIPGGPAIGGEPAAPAPETTVPAPAAPAQTPAAPAPVPAVPAPAAPSPAK